MIKYSEACLFCATWLLVNGNNTVGYILLGFSLLLGFARFSMKIHEEKEKQKNLESGIESISSAIQNVAAFGALNGTNNRKNEISH